MAGRALAVEPYASLNLMPGTVMPGDSPPTPGSRFSVALRITAVDTAPLPRDFDAVQAWICSDGRVWGDTLWAPRPDGDRRSLFRVLRGGVAWLEKLQKADVVVRLVGPGGTIRLLRLGNVRVEVSE